MTEEKTAKRPCEETDAESGEGNQQRHVRVAVGKEELRKSQGGRRAVNEEIVPFDGGTGEGGGGGAHGLARSSRNGTAHKNTPVLTNEQVRKDRATCKTLD